MNEFRDARKMTDSEKRVESVLESQMRAKNCLIAIQNELRRWNCKVEPVMTISSQGIQSNWAVAPLVEIKI